MAGAASLREASMHRRPAPFILRHLPCSCLLLCSHAALSDLLARAWGVGDASWTVHFVRHNCLAIISCCR